ncbi:MAG: hypothetical protein FJY37_10445, partial [Betaproteobacteria bacterium]|nr:hypothetical protein [Betaproteobacteria bacterium]
MKIESIDFFYLSMPSVLDIGDGSPPPRARSSDAWRMAPSAGPPAPRRWRPDSGPASHASGTVRA